MLILVTGAGGFVGRYLVAELLDHGHAVVATDLTPPPPGALPGQVPFHACDLQDGDGLRTLMADVRPAACAHLAGLSFVPLGWERPALMFTVNVLGSINLLQALRHGAPDARLLFVSSSEVYGHAARGPLKEDAPLRPDNPYALSKVAAEQMVMMHARRHGLRALAVRPCNHIGPGQAGGFVVPSFVHQLREIAAGRRPPLLKVGNLESRRVFLDVRDVACAYRRLLEDGADGRIYNLSGTLDTSIADVLDTLCRHAGVNPAREVDPKLYRPADTRPPLDTARMTRELNWHPRYSLDETLRDMLASGR